jgi:O-antigen ligase
VNARARTLRSSTHTPLGLLAAAASVAASVVVGATVVSRPMLALVPVATLAAALLIVDARARIALVVFGGIFLLQTQAGLDTKKLAFLAGFVVAFGGAVLNIQTISRTSAYRLARPLFAASFVLVGLAAVSLAVAYAHGIPQKDWLRDIAPYLFFAAAPVFAVDAQAAMSQKTIARLLLAGGLLTAAAFSLQWLQRRGIAHLPISRLGVATLFVPAALFAYAMSAALQRGTRRLRWLLLAALLLAMLVATSTRSTLALAVAPLAIAIGIRRNLTPRTVRLAILAPIAVVLTLALAQGVLVATGASQEVLAKRLEIFKSTGNEQADASYDDRMTQTGVAWNTFKVNPLFGAGAGAEFEWKPRGLPLRSSSALDTPATFPAKFGLLGLATALILVVTYWSFIRTLARRAEPTVAQLALVGYFAVVAVLTLLTNSLEDKGLSFGLILLLALVLGEAGQFTHARTDETRPSRSP